MCVTLAPFLIQGGTGPVLITDVKSTTCRYEVLWRTGHACPNNDVTTKECKFSNGYVTFDLTKLEKPIAYQVKVSDKEEFGIKVCSNGQPCGKFLLVVGK